MQLTWPGQHATLQVKRQTICSLSIDIIVPKREREISYPAGLQDKLVICSLASCLTANIASSWFSGKLRGVAAQLYICHHVAYLLQSPPCRSAGPESRVLQCSPSGSLTLGPFRQMPSAMWLLHISGSCCRLQNKQHSQQASSRPLHAT